MTPASDLARFCESLIGKYGSPDAASEEAKAGEFRKAYLGGQTPDVVTLQGIASACGIKLNGMSAGRMPENLRGFHDVYEGKRNIYYRSEDSASGIENTILHELREMMETLFSDVQPGYEPLRTSARHLAANRFAAAVLLPRQEFTARVYETGFDVVELSRLYSKSCSQVLLRMGEVLQGKIFSYGALYECSPKTCRWEIAYWTGSCNEDDVDANVRSTNGTFPRKGRPLLKGCLADLAMRAKKSYLAPRVTVSDDADEEGLTAIAQPMLISKVAAKVAMVVLMSRNADLLQPQIDRVTPTVVEGFRAYL